MAARIVEEKKHEEEGSKKRRVTIEGKGEGKTETKETKRQLRMLKDLPSAIVKTIITPFVSYNPECDPLTDRGYACYPISKQIKCYKYCDERCPLWISRFLAIPSIVQFIDPSLEREANTFKIASIIMITNDGRNRFVWQPAAEGVWQYMPISIAKAVPKSIISLSLLSSDYLESPNTYSITSKSAEHKICGSQKVESIRLIFTDRILDKIITDRVSHNRKVSIKLPEVSNVVSTWTASRGSTFPFEVVLENENLTPDILYINAVRKTLEDIRGEEKVNDIKMYRILMATFHPDKCPLTNPVEFLQRRSEGAETKENLILRSLAENLSQISNETNFKPNKDLCSELFRMVDKYRMHLQT